MWTNELIIELLVFYLVGCFVSLSLNYRLRSQTLPVICWDFEDVITFSFLFILSWLGLIASLIGFTIIRSHRW